MHTLQTIRETGSLPMTKAPVSDNSVDDRTKGKLFAQEIIALMVSQAFSWKDKVHALFPMTVEARAVTAETLKKWKEQTTDTELIERHGMDEKKARKFMNSATIRLSQINTIIKALNGGMTYDTLRNVWECDDPQELSVDSVYDTAKDFVGANAGRGRKPDLLLVKLSKWMEAQKKGLTVDSPAEDHKVMQELLNLYNRLAQ